MNDFRLIDGCSISFEVDRRLYSESVATKVLYWLSADYVIERTLSPDGAREQVLLTKKEGMLNDSAVSLLRARVSRDFCDFKLREAVALETVDLRTVLYIKAFANNDTFEEVDFDDEKPE